jgi:hypothetical protein
MPLSMHILPSPAWDDVITFIFLSSEDMLFPGKFSAPIISSHISRPKVYRKILVRNENNESKFGFTIFYIENNP